MAYPVNLDVNSVQIRYFAFNCLEIKLPTGKTVVVDPCLFKEGHFGCGYDVNDLEGCDYVFVNHSHGDHTDSLGELYNRFHPMIMAHAMTTYDLAKLYDIPYIRFIPFTFNDEFDFDDFKIKVVAGRHNNIIPGAFMARPSGYEDEFCGNIKKPPMPEKTELQARLGDLGTCYGSNFLMTLPNNLRIGLYAGNAGFSDPQDKNLWKNLHPDIIFAHRAKPGRFSAEDCAEKMVDIMEISGARIMVPIHIEDAYKGTYDCESYIKLINEVAERRGVQGRCLFMERGQWYQFFSGARKL